MPTRTATSHGASRSSSPGDPSQRPETEVRLVGADHQRPDVMVGGQPPQLLGRVYADDGDHLGGHPGGLELVPGRCQTQGGVGGLVLDVAEVRPDLLVAGRPHHAGEEDQGAPAVGASHPADQMQQRLGDHRVGDPHHETLDPGGDMDLPVPGLGAGSRHRQLADLEGGQVGVDLSPGVEPGEQRRGHEGGDQRHQHHDREQRRRDDAEAAPDGEDHDLGDPSGVHEHADDRSRSGTSPRRRARR